MVNGKRVQGFQYKDGKLMDSNAADSTRYIGVSLGSNGVPQIRNRGKLIETNKQPPEMYTRKEECCVCTACLTVCPVSGKENELFFSYKMTQNSTERRISLTGAISMIPDDEGFLYPVVDAEKCVRCYKCLEVCPYKKL